MIPVLLFDESGPNGLSLSQFEQNLLAICEDHRRENRACLFAVILHGHKSPQFSKALADKAYWIALNAISGRALTVFAVFDGVLREDSIEALRDYSGRLDELSRTHQRVLNQIFGIADLKMPALLFFQVSDGMVSDSRLIELKARTTDDAYLELSTLLEDVAQALKDSAGSLIRLPAVAFSKAESVIRLKEVGRVARAVGKPIKTLSDLMAIFW